ncbi:MAG: site-2 protease family protein [Ilumatobacter sp.]|nr:site-2 protease family protein [Ilumatobacter sp.]
MGTWLGIRVKVHWSVAVIGVLLGSMLADHVGWGIALVGVAGFLFSILGHEFAHALTARHYGVDTESIQLWALGGIARLRGESPTARAEGWIAAAGPLASLGLGVGFGAIWLLGGAREFDSPLGAMVVWLAVINALLALFNLLPGAPLDGGRIVKAVRWAQHGSRYRAAREAGRAGTVLAWLLTGAGFLLLVRDDGGLWLMITGLFVLVNAQVEIRAADIGERLDGLTVGDLAWYGLAHAGPDMDADSMLWQRGRLGNVGGVLVTDDAGGPQGLVLEDQLWNVPAEDRPWVLLTQLMVPLDGTTRAAPDEPLSSVLPRVDPRRPAVTVWRDDRLVGLITPERLLDRVRPGR